MWLPVSSPRASPRKPLVLEPTGMRQPVSWILSMATHHVFLGLATSLLLGLPAWPAGGLLLARSSSLSAVAAAFSSWLSCHPLEMEEDRPATSPSCPPLGEG